MKPKGYAFVEFRDSDVAKIAANSMNDYFMFGKRMSCKFIKDPKPNMFNSKHAPRNLKNIFSVRISIKKKKENKNVSLQRALAAVNAVDSLQQLAQKETAKREKLEKLGIDYQWRGFNEMIVPSSTHIKFDN